MLRPGLVLKRSPPCGDEYELFGLINRYGGMISNDVRDFVGGQNKTYITPDGTMWDLQSILEHISNRYVDGFTVY